MREPARDPGRLQDILTAADMIREFTEGLSREELMEDKLRFFDLSSAKKGVNRTRIPILT